MDFNKINTKADAEAGSTLHFKHPQLGHALYTGEGADDHGRLVNKKLPHAPVTALVRGLESDRIRNYQRDTSTKRLLDNDDEDRFGLAIALVIELNGVADGDRVLTASEADLRWFFGRSDYLAVQVVNHAQDRANFFKSASPT